MQEKSKKETKEQEALSSSSAENLKEDASLKEIGDVIAKDDIEKFKELVKIFYAFNFDDVEKFKEFMGKTDVFNFNETLLHVLCRGGTAYNIFGFLLENLENKRMRFSLINQQNAEGSTPLHLAAQSSDYMSRRLIGAGANPWIVNKAEETPLENASFPSLVEIVQSSYGDDINLISHCAFSQKDKLSLLFKCLNKFKNDEELKKAYLMAIEEAIERDNKEAFLALVEEKFCTLRNHLTNDTLLHTACLHRAYVIAVSILRQPEEKGLGTVKQTNANGDAPLHLAVTSKFLCKKLIDAEADPGAVNQYGETPLHTAIALQSIKNLPMEVISSSFFISDKTGEVALLRAVKEGYLEGVERLLEFLKVEDIVFEGRDKFGNNLLMIAAKLGYVEIFKYLLSFLDKKEGSRKSMLAQINHNGFNCLHNALLYNPLIRKNTSLENARSEQIKMLDSLYQTLNEEEIKELLVDDPIGRHPICLVMNDTVFDNFHEKLFISSELFQNEDIFKITGLEWLKIHLSTSKMKGLKIQGKNKSLREMKQCIRKKIKENPDQFCLKIVHPNHVELLNTLSSSIYFTNPAHREIYSKIIYEQLKNLCYSENQIMKSFLKDQAEIIQDSRRIMSIGKVVDDKEMEEIYIRLEKMFLTIQNPQDPEELDSLKGLFEKYKSTRNKKGQSFLHLAVSRENENFLRFLISVPLVVNVIDLKGKSPLDYANDKKNAALISILEEINAKIGEEISHRKHLYLTVITMYGETLEFFPFEKKEGGEITGCYSGSKSVYLAAEEPDLVPVMIHEWAHRFVHLFQINLETLQSFSDLLKVKVKYVEFQERTYVDCKKILLNSLMYDEEKQLEEFFVRSMQIIAKHGEDGIKFLEKNFPNLIEALLNVFEMRPQVVNPKQSSSSYGMAYLLSHSGRFISNYTNNSRKVDVKKDKRDESLPATRKPQLD